MQKMRFYENMHFPLGEITIFKVSSIKENSKFSKQVIEQHMEKQTKFRMFFVIDFLKNHAKIDQK